jgi:RNA polymerase sigma-70 factor (ECF subfamily)
MNGNSSTSSVCDEEFQAGTVGLPVVGTADDAIGQLLQGFRAYLLIVAREELAADLRGKCGASDVVQETFREAHRDWKAFRGKTVGDVRAWLRGILLNNVRDVTKSYRQTKRNAGLEVPIGTGTLHSLIDPELTPSASASAREEAGAIARAIAGLPADYRRVIELRSRENLPFQEIGRVLDRSPDAVRMLWFRAIESLRRELVKPDAT